LDEKFGEDALKAFIKMAPKDIDKEMLKEFLNAPEEVVNSLGDAERLYIAMLKIPRVEARLMSFLYKIQFNAVIARIKADVDEAHEAIRTIRGSELIPRYLELILAIGNFLNQGSHAGGAFGFTLDSLLKLKDTKSPVKPEFTLLHYLAQIIEKNRPKLLALPEEMSTIRKASAEYVQSILVDYQELKNNSLIVQQELDTLLKTDPDDPFVEKIGGFFKNSQKTLQQLTNDVEQMQADNRDLYMWFAAAKDLCVANTLIAFCRDFDFCVRQNQDREEKLKKAAERKKRDVIKSKSTKTSSKKKDMMKTKLRKTKKDDDKSKKKEEEEDEEYEEVIEEIEGEDGSDVEIIEEIEEVEEEED